MNTVVIPVFNESAHITKVIELTMKYVDHIVVVDDGSKDRTADIVEKLIKKKRSKRLHLLRHAVNLGKGSALKTGSEFAIKKLRTDNIIFMDGDLQHKPSDIPKMLDLLKECDIVFGCRRRTKNMPALFRIGNRVIDGVIKFLYDIDISDSQSGFRAFHAKVYRKIKWNSRDYSVESEMIANAGKHRLNYRAMKIATIYGDRYKGTTMIDGIKIVINMLLWKIGK